MRNNQISFPADKLEGRYCFRKYKAATGELVQELVSVPNIITNAGLIMAGTSWTPAYVFVGSGTAIPQPSDVTMQSLVARTSAIQTNWNKRSAASTTPGEWVEGTGTWRFGAGVAAGNLSEVGIGRQTTGSNYELFSRALIVDGSGNPITITVLSDEYLDVTYTLRSYASTAQVNTPLTISGVSYEMIIWRWNTGSDGCDPFVASRIDSPNSTSPTNTMFLAYSSSSGQLSFAGDIGSATPFTGTGLVTGARSLAATSYAEPSNYGAFCGVTAGLADANFANGIKGFSWTRASVSGLGLGVGIHGAQYRATVNPPIPKNSTNVLSLALRWNWARA